MTATTGLTLGKFAPLTHGHQLVIETALRETEHVVVLVYDSPETTPIPLPVRAGWVRRLYPECEVLLGWSGPAEVGMTPEIMARQERYILRILAGRSITHFYSSEPYGEHVSRALGAVNRPVDPERTRVPVSGSEARRNPFACRRLIDPVVYRDLVTWVVFLGAPSTGKTTLARRLARELGTVWMPEYGREVWEAHQVDRRLSPGQLVDIAEGHREREERLLRDADGYLFADTNALTSYLFGLHYHGEVQPRLAELATAAETRYDLVFVCDTDIPYEDTWDRSGEVDRLAFQRAILADLERRRLPFSLLSGDLEARVAGVHRALAGFEKWPLLHRPGPGRLEAPDRR